MKMDIEDFLEAVKWKRFGRDFSHDDEIGLLDIVAQNPCHLAAQLLLIECAHYNHPRFFPQFWTAYYKDAIEKGSECWKPDALAEIYLLGRQLYFYDQNNKAAEREAAAKAFELAPNYWRAIISYLVEFSNVLPVYERLKLIERITLEIPKNPLPYYTQARYFEDYVSEFGETRYRDAAIAAYQKSLALGMDRPPYVPRRVLEEKIRQLREMSDEETRGNQ